MMPVGNGRNFVHEVPVADEGSCVFSLPTVDFDGCITGGRGSWHFNFAWGILRFKLTATFPTQSSGFSTNFSHTHGTHCGLWRGVIHSTRGLREIYHREFDLAQIPPPPLPALEDLTDDCVECLAAFSMAVCALVGRGVHRRLSLNHFPSIPRGPPRLPDAVVVKWNGCRRRWLRCSPKWPSSITCPASDADACVGPEPHQECPELCQECQGLGDVLQDGLHALGLEVCCGRARLRAWAKGGGEGRVGGHRTARGGTGHLGRTETQRGRLWTACGQRCVDRKNSQTTPATTSTTPNTPTIGRR